MKKIQRYCENPIKKYSLRCLFVYEIVIEISSAFYMHTFKETCINFNNVSINILLLFFFSSFSIFSFSLSSSLFPLYSHLFSLFSFSFFSFSSFYSLNFVVLHEMQY